MKKYLCWKIWWSQRLSNWRSKTKTYLDWRRSFSFQITIWSIRSTAIHLRELRMTWSCLHSQIINRLTKCKIQATNWISLMSYQWSLKSSRKRGKLRGILLMRSLKLVILMWNILGLKSLRRKLRWKSMGLNLRRLKWKILGLNWK